MVHVQMPALACPCPCKFEAKIRTNQISNNVKKNCANNWLYQIKKLELKSTEKCRRRNVLHDTVKRARMIHMMVVRPCICRPCRHLLYWMRLKSPMLINSPVHEGSYIFPPTIGQYCIISIFGNFRVQL